MMRESDSTGPAFPITPILQHYGATHIPAGAWRSMRCPFHDDTRASASVNTDLGAFMCFACDTKGDAIKLVREQENMNYVDALHFCEGITGTSHNHLPTQSGRRDAHAGGTRYQSRIGGSVSARLR